MNTPIADTKPRDTIRHLDDDELATALHLARLAMPDLCDARSAATAISFDPIT